MRVAVLGATGYAGTMLLAWLARHPVFKVVAAVSEHAAGQPVESVMAPRPGIPAEFVGLAEFSEMDPPDLAFSAQENGHGLDLLGRLVQAGTRVVDLAAQFRLADRGAYEAFYGPHPAPDLLSGSFSGYADDPDLVYPGDRLLLGNPGCYPTAFALAVLPLVRSGLSLPLAFVDGKSGVSGAGRAPKPHLTMGEMAENVQAYSDPGKHRHTAEMRKASGGEVVFQPHLMPMRQGILLTIFIPGGRFTAGTVRERWEAFYQENPFVTVLPKGEKPRTAAVRDTNLALLGVSEDPGTGTVVLFSAIDNLVKGAAGQAIQHANRWAGLSPATGLI